MKEQKGILSDTLSESLEDQLSKAETTVGSAEHLTREWEMVRNVLTLLKNEGGALPLEGNRRTLILATNEYRLPTVEYAIDRMNKEGVLDASLVTTINYSELEFEDKQLQEALGEADQIVILSQSAAKNELVEKAVEKIHQKEDGKAVILSLNLPYDSATYESADAIICAYHPYGDAHDAEGNGPFNLNLAVGLSSVFGQSVPQGKLPVNVPKTEFEEDGTPSFTDEVLFERGFGLENWGDK